MKKLSTLLLCLFLVGTAFAQTPADSVAIVSIKWKTEKLKRGVWWKSAQVELYSSPQSINIIEVKPTGKNRLAIAYCTDTLILTSTLCNQANAVAGVNASFFDTKKGNSVDYMKVDGAVIHQGRDNFANSNVAIAIDGKTVNIIKREDNPLWAKELQAPNVLVAGPMLVNNAIIETLPDNSFNTTHHPRTAVSINKNGRILLVTVDGRSAENAEGMSTKELAYLLKILGAETAMNFDGGGSTAMYINGKEDNGIVNYPSDNKTFDHKGERKVANAVYVK